MEINTEHLKLTINGESYKLKLLTFKAAEEIGKSLEGMELEEKDFPKVLELKKKVIVESGLPEDVLYQLQLKHVNAVFDELVGSKKN